MGLVSSLAALAKHGMNRTFDALLQPVYLFLSQERVAVKVQQDVSRTQEGSVSWVRRGLIR